MPGEGREVVVKRVAAVDPDAVAVLEPDGRE
jgi:hypothetical protein